MATALDDGDIRTAVEGLAGWAYAGGKLTRTFTFGGFKEAVSFIVRVAMHAEEAGHHPEIFNVYNTVRLSLCTHDAGDRVTEKDIALARAINGFDWTS